MTGPAGARTITTKQVLLKDLQPYPGNAKTHDLDAIRESLRENGQYRTIVVRHPSLTILAGHGTAEAAAAEGWKKIRAELVECDDETARRIVLVDNRAPELGGFDDTLLAELLQSAPSLAGTGYDEEYLDGLLKGLVEKTPGKDTEPGAPPADPVTKRGDLICMGAHRLLCGDATIAQDVGRLFNGEAAVCMWTDPPVWGELRREDKGRPHDRGRRGRGT